MPSKSKSRSKKGKGKKKPLTDEEKLKQAELKALAEREKLLRRRQLTSAFLQLKKDKEYELVKLNDNKLLDLWRPRLRKLKCQEILEDYKMLQAAFERNYRKKDELLADLEELMRQNDEEYDNAFDMHLNNIDQILDFYRTRMNEVRDLYKDQRNKIHKVLKDEENRMQRYQDKSLRYLRSVHSGVNLRYRELASDSKAELFVRQGEIRNKALEETQACRIETDRRMKAVWDDIQKLLTEYDDKVTPLRCEFQELRAKDDLVAAVIDKQFHKMYNLQMGIESLTEKDKNYCLAVEKYVAELTEKRIVLKAQYKLKNQRFKFLQKMGRTRISQLALLTQLVLDGIDEMVAQRERLMKIIERCRKRERLDEKLDPFLTRWGMPELSSTFALDDPESVASFVASSASQGQTSDNFNFNPKKIEHKMSCDCNPCLCAVQERMEDQLPDGVNIVHQFAFLERFWIRFNRVSLERQVLIKKRAVMLKDNEQLKMALRSYMGGLNPLQHAINGPFTDNLLNSQKKNHEMMMRLVTKEKKRKQRCKASGGLKVH